MNIDTLLDSHSRLWKGKQACRGQRTLMIDGQKTGELRVQRLCPVEVGTRDVNGRGGTLFDLLANLERGLPRKAHESTSRTKGTAYPPDSLCGA